MLMESNLNKFIEELIQEVENELDEATTSGAAGAYSTPNAFSDGGSKDKKLKKKIATQLGMKLVGKVNEAKIQRPVNRWLAIKNDETKHPHKKMAMGLKELKYQLAETQKFFNWYNKIKSMNELDSSDYWKRTNKHIYKIKERLINIAKTIQEIEK
jgi:hypothetical protein